jgi:hypothetical protein
VQQARVTGDPSNYPRAEEVLNRSLAVRPAADRRRPGTVRSPLPGTTSRSRCTTAPGAREVVNRALAAATGPTGAAFALDHPAGPAFDNGDLDTAIDNGDLDTAMSTVEEGLRRLPGHPPLLAMRGRALAARGDTAGAVGAYTASLAKLPRPGPAAELGDLLAVTGDPAGAQRRYDLMRASAALLRADGVDVDGGLAVFAADHGDVPGAPAGRPGGIPRSGLPTRWRGSLILILIVGVGLVRRAAATLI